MVDFSPLLLLEIHDDGEITVNDIALTFLENIAIPVSVISVVGGYRTGKSTLLNILFGIEKGFGVDCTINRCTRGIWICGISAPNHLSSGEVSQILVLDTEGLGSAEADADYDARIFILALLLSSLLIYNSVGCIDDKAI
eukprot:gene43681-58183_t